MDNDALVRAARDFLESSMSGRWEEAARYVAPGVVLKFPTGEYRSLEALAVGLAGRYRWIRKRFGTFDIAPNPNCVVVGVSGTLEGENIDGVRFRDVRFFDRLVFNRAGLIMEQHVFNDLSVTDVLQRRQEHCRKRR